MRLFISIMFTSSISSVRLNRPHLLSSFKTKTGNYFLLDISFLIHNIFNLFPLNIWPRTSQSVCPRQFQVIVWSGWLSWVQLLRAESFNVTTVNMGNETGQQSDVWLRNPGVLRDEKHSNDKEKRMHVKTGIEPRGFESMVRYRHERNYVD